MAALLLVGMFGAALLGVGAAQDAAVGQGTRPCAAHIGGVRRASVAPDCSTAAGSIIHHLPDYMLILLAGGTTLALVAARVVTRPLARLVDAAETFATSLHPSPLPETGPTELRAAIATFNLMQRRVSDGFAERIQMLSAVNHDLRTPLTRLKLRLDQVSDEDLRNRLRADVALIGAMVSGGLELARSDSVPEPWERVDLDALLQTVADNAAETGATVDFREGCGVTIRTRPDTLTRCITNLVDNAVRYAGSAVLTCRAVDGMVEISVADTGPGIAEAQFEEAFRPFTRLGDPSRQVDGSGLGLTIARQQARSIGGEVWLCNRAERGLVARVTLRGET
ncbi:MAG: ATP-binding protein [Janthinobacterium lividum]